ncbi:type I 3-dehydroquinate dehydratase [Aquimarina sediminis]|uniref:type I 3-dehydroquinate dehydratase n=1 Tax=Aquimarina sediminis TaxID=2070536 RepID=UPI000CA00EE2|nr:type I 3-dehydroquinate dehydratase [Aquimarina sediminis]
MQRKVQIVTSITHDDQICELSYLPNEIGLIEVRADLLSDISKIKDHTNIPIIYALRSKEEGGLFEGTISERYRLLKEASIVFDYVELEGDRDLAPEVLDFIPKNKRRIVWYGSPENHFALITRIQKYTKVPASRYKIVVTTDNHSDGVTLMSLLNAISNTSIVVYAIGLTAEWTQVLSPFLGAPEVQSTLAKEKKPAPHFLTRQLIEDYGLPYVYPIKQLFGIVGNPVLESISPKQHNQGYRTLGLPYLYLPFHTNNFSSFTDRIMQSPLMPVPLSGLTVVSPFKANGYAVSIDNKAVDKVKICNGLIRKEQGWKSFSTDPYGVIQSLNQVTDDWSHKKIAIIGCGGTGRTIASTLKRMNIRATLVNRTIEKGRKVAASLKLSFIALQAFDASLFDIIIHATPLGKNQNESPFDITQLNNDSIVIDHVYSLEEDTELVQYCQLCDIEFVDGKEIARLQISQQFKFMTGIEMPKVKKVTQNLKIN